MSVYYGAALLLLTAPCCSSVPSSPGSANVLAISQFLLDYALWRRWDQVVLFVPSLPGSLLKESVKLLNSMGIQTGLQPVASPQLPSAFLVTRHRLGAVLLPAAEDSVIADLMEQVSQKMLFNTYISWLIIHDTHDCLSNITWEDQFLYLNVGLDSDVVFATKQKQQNRSAVISETSKHVNNAIQVKSRQLHRSGDVALRNGHKADDYPKSKESNSTEAVPTNGTLHRDEMFTRKAKPRRIWHRQDLGIKFHLKQVYKLRNTANTSVITIPLGMWDPVNGSFGIKSPLQVEERNDMQGMPLYIGIKNASMASNEPKVTKDHMITSIDDDIDDDNNLIDVLEYIAKSVNATYELISYSKLGWKNEEEAWLYLLGAVTEGTVDLGLDNVIITQERSQDMFFTFSIVESMKNIYFRQPDTGAMRDIFLAPFSPHLILCVAATGMILAIAVTLINASTHKRKSGTDNKISSNICSIIGHVGSETKDIGNTKTRWGLGEAAVWSISVLCMQGSPWNPSTASGSLVLIFGLCFALIIYNAYAAFITSVLSVRVTSIKGLNDLLKSDFQFGYTLAGQDELFLRTVNDSSLRSLYFRGLVQNQGVEDTSVGLLRVANGGYAFFVSSRLARRGLNTFVARDKRCGIQELTVESTRSVIALPMNLLSPYRKLINVSLLRMREAGVLHRIQEQMLPSMPRCQAYTSFNSARLSDVYSAFLLLGAGLLVGMGLGIAEALWRRRIALAKLVTTRCHYRRKLVEANEQPQNNKRRTWKQKRNVDWHN